MAKKKSKTIRRKKTVRTARAGAGRTRDARARCQPLREQLMALDEEIGQVRDSLTDPDIPAGIKARLRILLRQLLATRTRVRRALEVCERVPVGPRL